MRDDATGRLRPHGDLEPADAAALLGAGTRAYLAWARREADDRYGDARARRIAAYARSKRCRYEGAGDPAGVVDATWAAFVTRVVEIWDRASLDASTGAARDAKRARTEGLRQLALGERIRASSRTPALSAREMRTLARDLLKLDTRTLNDAFKGFRGDRWDALADRECVRSSVVYLVDRSLDERGPEAFERQIRNLKAVVEGLERDDEALEVALYAYGGGCWSIERVEGFTTDLGLILDGLRDLRPASADRPVGRALKTARAYLSREGRGATGRVKLMTKGADTCDRSEY